MQKSFYGRWIIAAAFITFGISVGLPYYNMPFFYDYYEKAFNWSRPDITLGFPLAALLTLWVGPILVPKISPRKLIVIGTGLTFAACFGFSKMTGDLNIYYLLWFIYTFGYILSGPIPHQIIVSQWFKKSRGMAMGIVYVGVGLVGAAGPWLLKPMTEAYTFRGAMLAVGCVMFLAWPFALFMLRDKPSDLGQFPDGALEAHKDSTVAAHSFGFLLKQWPFWLLLIGSLCSIGSIGAINQHMKLVFKDAGFKTQADVNGVWFEATRWILWSSIAGRLLIGRFADMFSMKNVMTVTYFIVAASIPLLLSVKPGGNPYVFAIVFGFAMGADYMLIPLMAAKQFGVNSLSRSMAIILPVNTIGQTWVPYGLSWLRKQYPSYETPMMYILGISMIGAVAILLLPKDKKEDAPPAIVAEPAAARG